METPLPEGLKKKLIKQGYRFIGKHSAVKVCEWTKRSIRDEDFCYKQKFYGIESHRCCQMSPSIGFCSEQCVFCWRPQEYNLGTDEILDDDPVKMVDRAIDAQKKLLEGFGGNDRANKKKLKESYNPTMFAISLAGEPTLYKNLSGLILELRKRKIRSFLVTNGNYPEKLLEILGNAEPDQLYITLPAPDERSFLKICRPTIKDAWKKLMESLSLLQKFKCRTVIRLTLVEGLNLDSAESYAKIIEGACPDFVECKGYVWVGYSRQRLKEHNMPSHERIFGFAKEIQQYSSYKIKDEKIESRVVLLTKS